jgi:hypothetical protein
LLTDKRNYNPPDGGRTWWAHFEFTRINIAPTILRKKIEELRMLSSFLFSPARVSHVTSREVG